MRIAGLSGGIACGKSTVSALLQAQEITVIDCDLIARDVCEKGRWGWHRVVAAFGREYLLPNGELDRDRLGSLVFSDRSARRRLNAATHLPVGLELLRRLLWAWLTLKWIVVIDMPLLFETGAYKWTRPRILVYCDHGTQARRLIARDRCTPEAAVSKISSQIPLDAKVPLSDVVLDNNGSVEELQEQVQALAQRLKRGTRWWGIALSPITVGSVCAFALLSGLR